MKPKLARKELEKRILKSGKKVEALTLAEGIQFMMDFYQQVRAEDCPLEEDGDMLLYEWGTYDADKGRLFQCGITRQFIQADSEGDDGMSQLSLKFYFQPSAASDALESGNEWCYSPEGVEDFDSFMKGNAAFQAVQSTKPAKVAIEYGEI
ncbi:MAG: hypothetical protein JWQ71_1417 [Pedosphaera sp.]|nr:hypothetical protein [Pedosphaera sp.]